jgi:uncharacterized protein with PIN domain
MESTITALKASNPTCKSTLKNLTAKLTMLKSAPTTSELQSMVDTLRVHNAAKAEKLAAFKSGTVMQFSKEEMAAVEEAFKYWGKAKKARKVAYLGLEDCVLGMGDGNRNKDDVREEFGIEVD